MTEPVTMVLLSVLFAQYPQADQAYATPDVHVERMLDHEVKFSCDAPATIVSKVVTEDELGTWSGSKSPIIFVTCTQASS